MTTVERPVPAEAAPTHVAVFVAPPEAVAVLRSVLGKLPPEFPAALVILLHPGDGSERPVANNLNVDSGVMVMPGSVGGRLRNGRATVLLASQGLTIGDDARFENGAGSLLASLAAHYGRGAIAIALTALDASEIEGFRLVREAGGHTIALDEADVLWTHPSGPRVVAGAADELLAAGDIGRRMLAILSSS